jgi:hypothetical protein
MEGAVRNIKKGSTDQSVVIRIIDSTTGLPETAVEHDTSGIDLWYRREGATKTSITEAALAALDSVHSDGGIEHIGDGYYRLDLPDAAVAAGANGVMVGGAVTGMIVVGVYVALVDYDPYDSVRAGLTSLPNAAADAAGGLPISDVGGLDLDAKLANTNEVTAARMGALTDLIDGGRLDLILDAILADSGTTLDGKLDTLLARATEARLAELDAANLPADIATAIAYIDTEIDAIKAKTDNLPADPADASDIAAAISGVPAAVIGATLSDLSDTNVDTGETITLAKAIRALFNRFFRKVIQTAAAQTVYNDSGAAMADMVTNKTETTTTRNGT